MTRREILGRLLAATSAATLVKRAQGGVGSDIIAPGGSALKNIAPSKRQGQWTLAGQPVIGAIRHGGEVHAWTAKRMYVVPQAFLDEIS